MHRIFKQSILLSACAIAVAFVACQQQNSSGMVHIPANPTQGVTDFYIDAFENTVSPMPSGGNAAISTQGVLPDVSISYSDASTACQNAGKRLCTQLEWMTACEGSGQLSYGFQADPTTPANVQTICNLGKNVDAVPGLVNTGSDSGCTPNGYSIYDMVGNASEWVTYGGNPAAAGSNYTSDTSELDSDCTVNNTLVASSTSQNTIGFRCCKNYP